MFPFKPSVIGGFPIAMFDFRRVETKASAHHGLALVAQLPHHTTGAIAQGLHDGSFGSADDPMRLLATEGKSLTPRHPNDEI